MKTPTTDRWKYRRTPYADHRDDGTGYYALAAAIVRQAVDDYRAADRMERGEITYCEGLHSPRYVKDGIVKFFRSQWYGTLCDIPAERIIRRLRNERN